MPYATIVSIKYGKGILIANLAYLAKNIDVPFRLVIKGSVSIPLHFFFCLKFGRLSNKIYYYNKYGPSSS